MPVEEYWAPTSLPAALEHLRGGDVTILAGGTDLMPQSHAGRVTFKRGMLNIQRVAELHRIDRADGGVRIGALVTMSELMRDPLVREQFGILVEACDHFASDQLRNAATLGGNVCNASPAGDTLVPLLVLDGVAELASKPDGRVETRLVLVPSPDFVRAYESRQRKIRTGAWISTAVAAAGITAAAILQVSASQLYGNESTPGTFLYDRRRLQDGVEIENGVNLRSQAASLKSRIETRQTWSYVSGGAGAAAAVAATWLWIVGEDPGRYAGFTESAPSARLEVAPAPGGALASLSLSF